MVKKVILSIVSLFVVIVIVGAVVFSVTRNNHIKHETEASQTIIKNTAASLQNFMSSGETTFTVLVENNTLSELADIEASHGISLFVERKGTTFLLDVGDNDIYHKNAMALDKDITDVDMIFISHGHKDHGGGLDHALTMNKKAKVFLSENALTEKHSVKILGVMNKDMSFDADLLEKYPDRIVFIHDMTEIAQDIFIIPSISRKYPLPVANKSLFKRSGGKMIPDDFDHEQLFVIKDSDGLIVYSGCNHNGILNSVFTVNEHFPGIPIKAVIGGFHLFDPVLVKMAEESEDVTTLGENMRKFDVQKYITGHCTGVEAYTILKSTLQEHLEYFSAGSHFEM